MIPGRKHKRDKEGKPLQGTAEVSYVLLACFASPAEAGMVYELLIKNGIRALLKGASFGALEPLPLPGGYSEIRLLVAHADFLRAQQFYEAFFARPLRNADAPVDNQELSDE
ncbi:MAG TPA: hypothetical protein VNQ79_01010 [Blastocatellia bacterium]|nr:hypothetical protein [Blastocatellia bacterium]